MKLFDVMLMSDKELTRKEKESMKKMKDKTEITAKELAEMNDVSYTAARELLESMTTKGVLGYRWEPKGNRKKYIIKE